MFLIKCNIKIYLQSQYAWGPNPIPPLFGHVNLSQLFNFSVLISSSVKWKEYLMTGWVGNQNPAPFLNNETRCNLHSGAPSEWPKSHAHLKPHPCVAPSLSWFCFPLSLTSFPSKNYIYTPAFILSSTSCPAFNKKVQHTKRQKNSLKRQQALKADSDKATMLELSNQKFKTTMLRALKEN